MMITWMRILPKNDENDDEDEEEEDEEEEEEDDEYQCYCRGYQD